MPLALLPVVPTESRADSPLEAARREISDASPQPRERDDEEQTDSDSTASILGALTLEEPGENQEFLPYPYAKGRRGYILRAPTASDRTKALGFHLQAEGAYLYEDVWRASAMFRAAQAQLYMQGGYDLMLEGPTPRLDGDIELEGSVRDRLHFVSLEVGGQFAPSPVVAIRAAPVLTVLFEDRRSTQQETLVVPWLGWSVGADVFPVRPLVLRARAAIHGSFGVAMPQLRATAGVSLRNVEIYAGYDQRWIGSVGLGGPTAGLAVRF